MEPAPPCGGASGAQMSSSPRAIIRVSRCHRDRTKGRSRFSRPEVIVCCHTLLFSTSVLRHLEDPARTLGSALPLLTLYYGRLSFSVVSEWCLERARVHIW